MQLSARRLRQEKKKIADLEIILDPVEAAEDAGLRYVSDEQPGYTRQQRGKKFVYFDTDGKEIKDETRILRINRLAIPPAYRDVWICPSPNGHLQATGRDDRGRKQYRYHERWRIERDENKYEKMVVFGQSLPKIRRRVTRDLKRRGLPREKVLATVVDLLEKTMIRIGNEEYAKENKSFGLTTLRDRHIDVRGDKLHFHFRGKSGIDHQIPLTDRRVAKIVKKLQHLPGQEVFQYLDEKGERHQVTSDDVNAYLHEITGEEFTAKDFRTWAGTVSCAAALREALARTHTGPTNRQLMKAVEQVAAQLRNTPAVCRKSYIHPGVIASYLDGTLPAMFAACARRQSRRRRGLRTDEAAVLALLGPNRRQRAGGLTSSRP